ncbi:ribosomal RNA small subunit methyltransferase E [Sphingomonas sp. DBB INV C78]
MRRQPSDAGLRDALSRLDFGRHSRQGGIMPATPAWPPASTPRLFIDSALGEGMAVPVDGAAANYLGNVMRLKEGDPVRLFDDRTGEWLAEVSSVSKRSLTLAITAQLSVREDVPDLWLVAAPIKKGRIDWVAEKACELGVARLVPVITRRTIVDRLNVERLRTHMIEAAEQCGRTALPEITEPVKLGALLRDWPADRTLYFADEAGGLPFVDVAKPGPAAILVGPEGGFTDEERVAIRAVPGATGTSLGPRILRAETAAAAAIAIWMAAAGDWRSESR